MSQKHLNWPTLSYKAQCKKENADVEKKEMKRQHLRMDGPGAEPYGKPRNLRRNTK